MQNGLNKIKNTLTKGKERKRPGETLVTVLGHSGIRTQGLCPDSQTDALTTALRGHHGYVKSIYTFFSPEPMHSEYMTVFTLWVTNGRLHSKR